ncbi:fumarylacetoacetate hydrolase family protein [Solimonas marina]|uniref:Fumarylacetoacetate hydrolase family protein n=1 Tax=Solimonas marina TaxID=2714601 RepID=A0A969WBJ8_9GAMM|nr:fumarylacetoacetate hydrolase family protein [Solimonas marina]NKF23533.1 fumarylacetoacetate hydrolase family protein [Solimonas marina]
MSVNVIRYEFEGAIRWGVAKAGLVTPIDGEYATTADFLKVHSAQTLAGVGGGTLAESSVRCLSPVTRNQQFVCQGANYRQHMIESGLNPDEKTYNMIFTKATSCMTGAYEPVIRPAAVKLLDYEVELGLVFSRDITSKVRVTDANLHEFIAGIVIVNDYSARDVQIPQMQFYKGKSFRSFGPVGPYLCLLDASEIGVLGELDLQLSVNGEIRQKDNTRNLVYGPAETLTELSGVQDFHVGDLLATGTPSGCALSVPSPGKQKIAALLPEHKKWAMFHKIQLKRTQYLKPGDVVETSIRCAEAGIDLGVQRNAVVQGV